METFDRRLLHVAWLKSSYGGAHKYLDRLAQRLLERGADVTLAVNAQQLVRPFLEALRERGAEVLELPMDESPQQSARMLDDWIATRRPGLVHFNSGARQPRAVAQQMTCWRAGGFRSVFTMHLPIIAEMPSVIDRCRARLPLTRTRARMAQRIAFAKRFDRIISVSQRFAALNSGVLRLDPGTIVTIPNGVDVHRFAPRAPVASDAAAGPVVIGGCGGLVEQKRFDLLIAAAARLNRQSFQIRIAGEGSQRPRLEQMIDTLGLSGRVQLVGHQSDIPRFLHDLDIFCMPSDYEAFPYSQLEAMATGLPSIVTDVGDLPLMARHGRESLVIRPGNVAALSEALQALIDDAPTRRTMGQAARRRVVEQYEQSQCEDCTLEAFDSLLQHTPESVHLLATPSAFRH